MALIWDSNGLSSNGLETRDSDPSFAISVTGVCMTTGDDKNPVKMFSISGGSFTGDGLTCSAAQMQASPCQQGDDSHCAKRMKSLVQLPEDILHRIHGLMPIRNAAHAACVSRGLLCSWKFYPNIFLSVDSLGIKGALSDVDKSTRAFMSRVNHIMQNHSGMGVKMFRLQTYPCSTLPPNYVDRWLQVAITPGIKEFKLLLFDFGDIKYNFLCSVLSSERASSIQSFMLAGCSLRSTTQVGSMSSLKVLDLRSVDITDEELYCFLSNSFHLEKICLHNCDDIICFKIPCLLQRRNTLDVRYCEKLEMIDSNAPNLSSFSYIGHKIHISFGDVAQVREIRLRWSTSDVLYYASAKLPFIAANLQTLVLTTSDETVNTPLAFGKFLQLKYLEIMLLPQEFSPHYDFYSLVSLIDASPALETFILRIGMPTIRHDSILEDLGDDSSHPWRLSEYCHENLKNVMITGFCSAKSMIEFTLHIIEKTKSLECLTLDTTRGHDRRFANIDRCWPLNREALVEAERARVAIRSHVKGRVPPAVNLKIIEPCSKCVPDCVI